METNKSKYKQAILLLALPIFLAVFFVFMKFANAYCREGAMIYEVYGGGGNSGATFNSDYVMLYNSTPKEISLDGWLLQYASSNSSFTSDKATPLSGSLPAKGYFLIKQGNRGSVGSDLPVVDNVGSMNANLAADKGKLSLVHGIDVVNSEDPSFFDDFVAYSGGSNTKSVYRKNISCLDTDSYVADFGTHVPNPKNSSTHEDDNGDTVDKIPVCKEKIFISEIFPFSGEFVEVKNDGQEKCDLAGWKISDQANDKHDFPSISIIEPGKYFAFMKDFGLNVSSSDGARLFNPSGTLVEEKEYPKPTEEDVSFSKDDKDGWDWAEKTPGEENIFAKVFKEYPAGLIITELFPNPFNSKYEEYIELYNGTSEKVDLVGWTLHDASISGKHTFLKSTVIEAKKYLAVFKNEFSFALNNSGEESVTLFDPNGKKVSSVSYDGSKQNASYDFDGTDWHWSKFLTPGEENIFNNQPYGTVVIDDDVFVNVYADFSVSTGDADGDEVKVVWDFGDGHKSYLAKTKHKYAETGKYSGSVKLSDGSEDVVKNFTVEVGEISHPKVRIIAVNANPKGTDTGEESLTIENKSSKKVNLSGWSIATGWKKFINHPIREDVIIKKGKTVEVTHDVSSFTLNNTKAKIQLRYPDGKVAQEVKYKKTEGIEEGEVFQHKKGGWVWTQSQKSINSVKSVKQTEIADKEQESVNSGQEENSVTSNQSSVISEENKGENDKTAWKNVSIENKRRNKILENDDKLIKIELLKNQPQVLGMQIVREEDGQYYFTQQVEQKHYLVSFVEKLCSCMNFVINSFMNYVNLK